MDAQKSVDYLERRSRVTGKMMNTVPATLISERLVLGTYGAAHLGDILCSTPLPERLFGAGIKSVTLQDLPVCRTVFANNPFVSGFSNDHAISLDRRARGNGHLIQRLLQSFELPLSNHPKPELYFSDEELEWAKDQRDKLSVGKPICLLATRAFTDYGHLESVDWPGLGSILSESFTVVQAIITKKSVYQDQIAGTDRPWSAEPVVKGATVYKDLTLRQYLALFKAIDLYVGPPSGGSHAAAAVDVPALILLWNKLLGSLTFPVPGHLGSVNEFLYPYHRFIGAEQLHRVENDAADRLRAMLSSIELSRPSSIFETRSERGQMNVVPPPAIRWVRTQGGRIVKMPGNYGDGSLITPWAIAPGV